MKCDRSHEHTPCAGSNTLGTQGYTDRICKIIHQSIRHDIAVLGERVDDHEEVTIAMAVIQASAKETLKPSAAAVAAPALCATSSLAVVGAMSIFEQDTVEISEGEEFTVVKT